MSAMPNSSLTRVVNIVVDPAGARAGGAEVNRIFNRMRQSTIDLNRSVYGLLGAFAGFSALRNVVNELIAFEKALIGVGKTTNTTGKELQQFGRDIILLTTHIPLAGTELLALSKVAGQMGIRGSSQLLKFTETLAKLSFTSNVAGEEAALALGKILNITNEPSDNIDKLASSLVKMGNTARSTESAILRVANRVASSTATLSLSSADVIGLAATLSELGTRAELSGSAVGRTMRAISIAIDEGGKKLQFLAELTGKTPQEFTAAFRDDRTAGFVKFLESLKQFMAEGGNVTNALKQLGLAGEEVLSVIPTLAKRSDLLVENLINANAEFTNGAKELDRESSAAFKGLGARIQILQNHISALKFTLLEQNPVLAAWTDKLSQAIGILAGLPGYLQNADIQTKYLAASIKALGIGIGVLLAFKTAVFFTILAEQMATATISAIRLTASFAAMAAVIGSAFVSFEFGKYLYDEFKIVQIVADGIVLTFDRAWLAIDTGIQLLVAKTSTYWEDMVEGATTALSIIIEGAAALASEVDLATGNALMKVAEDLRGSFTGNDMFSFADKSVKEFSNSVGNAYMKIRQESPAVQKAFKSILQPFIEYDTSVAKGGRKDLYLNKSVVQDQLKSITTVIATLEADSNVANKAIADTLKRSRDKYLESATKVYGNDLRVPIIEAERTAKFQALDELEAQMNKDREAAFKGQAQRTGRSFGDFLASELEGTTAIVQKYLGSMEPMLDKFLGMPASSDAAKEALDKIVSPTVPKAIDDAADSMDNLVQKMNELGDRKINDALDMLDLELELLYKTNEERERAIQLRQFEQLVDDRYGLGTEGASAKIAEFTERLDRLQDSRKLERVAQGIGDAFGNAFGDIITGVESVQDAFENLGRSILQAIVQQAVVAPISGALTGLFGNFFGGIMGLPAKASYQGNVFQHGSITPFARGGVVSDYTTFPMRHGIGSMGERGPEAIMPLQRDASGNLGVRGGGNQTIIFNVTTPDADSFRKSRGQITNELKRAASAARG